MRFVWILARRDGRKHAFSDLGEAMRCARELRSLRISYRMGGYSDV